MFVTQTKNMPIKFLEHLGLIKWFGSSVRFGLGLSLLNRFYLGLGFGFIAFFVTKRIERCLSLEQKKKCPLNS